jgi:hypothetical protein
MIKLTKEDLIFKKAAEYSGPDKLAAISLETADDARIKKAKPYNQQSVTGLLKSVWAGMAPSKKKMKAGGLITERNHYRSRS